MPLTVRQFDLGIDQEMDGWMRQVYELLIRNQHLAYSSEELSREVLGASAEEDNREKFVLALDVLSHFAKRGIPCLGVHDSFIVPAVHKSELWQVMTDCHRERIGFLPVIK